jgi:hypothetical protein
LTFIHYIINSNISILIPFLFHFCIHSNRWSKTPLASTLISWIFAFRHSQYIIGSKITFKTNTEFNAKIIIATMSWRMSWRMSWMISISYQPAFQWHWIAFKLYLDVLLEHLAEFHSASENPISWKIDGKAMETRQLATRWLIIW